MARIVFRGNSQPLDDVFANGFQPHPGRLNGGVLAIQPGGQMIGGVSTSKDIGVAMRYAAAYDGHLFACWVTEGVDVLDFIVGKSKAWWGGDQWKGGIKNAASQAEIAVPSVPANMVIAARRANVDNKNGKLSGPIQLNPHYTGPAQAVEEAKAWLNANVEVPMEVAH